MGVLIVHARGQQHVDRHAHQQEGHDEREDMDVDRLHEHAARCRADKGEQYGQKIAAPVDQAFPHKIGAGNAGAADRLQLVRSEDVDGRNAGEQHCGYGEQTAAAGNRIDKARADAHQREQEIGFRRERHAEAIQTHGIIANRSLRRAR